MSTRPPGPSRPPRRRRRTTRRARMRAAGARLTFFDGVLVGVVLDLLALAVGLLLEDALR